jgi:uncharacterized protein
MKAVVVFTKVPERGAVKTRLQRKIPAYLVEELYIAFLTDTLEKLRDHFPYVAYWPPNKMQALWTLLGERKYLQQRGADLGEKLANVFSDFYKMGVRDLAIVGCDAPTMKAQDVEDAFGKMDSADVVLGPAHDGGFWLIGGRGFRKELFDGVDWNGTDAYEKVWGNASSHGLKTATLPLLRDVDTPEDLDAVWSSGDLDKGGQTYRILRKIKHA